MSLQPAVLHADLDAFYASVEQRDAPALRGRPVIVGPGVVLACSYEAKARGVSSGMGARAARRLCPDAVVVPARFSAYVEASRAVFAIFEETSPVVEALSIDEAFLDVRGLEHIRGTPLEIARRLREDVRSQVGLPLSVGLARTKFLAKVASAMAKPDGLLVVMPDRELAFLHPLPVQALWGVGAKTAAKLHAAGLTTVGEVARVDEATLCAVVGRGTGRQLHALAHNRDPRRVRPRVRRRSIGSQHALGPPRRRTAEELDAILVGVVDRVTRRLRKARRSARTVVLRLRFGDYTRATRSRTMVRATAQTEPILATARRLLAAAGPLIEARGITLLGLAVTNLEDNAGVQLALPLGREREAVVDAAVDDVRARFGTSAITRGVLVGRDRGIEVPLLED